jgi:hypothetical protein
LAGALLVAGQAAALDLNLGAGASAAADASATAGGASIDVTGGAGVGGKAGIGLNPTDGSGALAAGAATAATGAASLAVGAQGQNLRVFSSNGVNVGTAISTTTGPGGTFITIQPAASFMTGIGNFQVSASSATTANGQLTLAMTDAALRAQVSAALAANSAGSIQ